MKDRIKKFWNLLLHTCVFHTFSIVAGALLTFTAIAGLNIYLPVTTTLAVCPFFTMGIYTTIVTAQVPLIDIFFKYELQSKFLGVFIGCLWIILVACI